jgi:hypothetical protein
MRSEPRRAGDGIAGEIMFAKRMRKPRATGLCAVMLAAALWPAAAFGGPPFVTDDPVPVDVGNWEINNALTGTLVRGAAATGLPSIDANYGVFAGVQLHVQPQFSVVWSDGVAQAGAGDTQFGAKIRLLDEDKQGWMPMVSIYPIFTAPTGNAGRGLGAGVGRMFLPVWADKTFGKWIVDGGAGLSIDPGGQGRNAWFVGGLLLYQFTDALQLGGEAFLQTAQARGARDAPGFNLGGSYDLSRTYHLLFSAGQGLANVAVTNRLSFYLALQITF